MHLQEGVIVRMARSRARERATLAQKALRVVGLAARALLFAALLWAMGLVLFGAVLSA